MKRKKPKAILAQVRTATRKTHRGALIAGSILGGFVPLASWWLVHNEVTIQPMLWIIATGGLIYSSFTVYQWAKVAFSNPMKALGFVVILEGVMTFSSTAWLSIAALALLVVINGIACACQLVEDSRS